MSVDAAPLITPRAPLGALAPLIGAVAVIGSNSLGVGPIAGAVAADFAGVSAADVVRAGAGFGAGVAAAALALAPYADRIGAERALLAALGAIAAGLAACASAPGLWAFLLGQALAGVGAGVALPAAYTLAAQIAPEGREARTLSAVLSGWTVSMVAGVWIAGLIADWAQWRWVFIGLSAAACLAALAVARRRDWGVRAAARISSPLSALAVPGMTRALAVAAAFMIGFYGAYAYLGPHAVERLGRTAAEAGALTVAYGLGFGAASALGGALDRIGAGRAAPIVFAALIALYGALAVGARAYVGLALLAVPWGFVNHFGLMIVVGRVGALDPSQRAAALGLFSAVAYGGLFLGVAAWRPLYEALGLAGPAVASAVLLTLATLEAAHRPRRPG